MKRKGNKKRKKETRKNESAKRKSFDAEIENTAPEKLPKITTTTI